MTQSTSTNSITYQGLDDQELEKRTVRNFLDEINQLEQTNNCCTGKLKELKDKKKLLDTDEEQCAAHIKNTVRLIENEQEQLKELHRLLTANNEKQDEIEKEITQQEINLDDDEGKLLDELNKLNNYEKHRDRYYNQKFNLEQEKQSIEHEKQEIEQRMQQIREHTEELEQTIKEKKQSMQTGEVDIALIQHELDEILHNIAHNEEEMNILEEKLRVLKEKLLIIERELNRLNAELSRINNLIERIENMIKIKQEQTDNLQQTNVDLQDQLKKAQEKHIDIEGDIRQWTKQIDEKKQAIELLKTQLKEILKVLTKEEKQVRIAEEAVEQSKQKLSQKEQECTELKRQEEQINQQLYNGVQEYGNAERMTHEKSTQIEQLVKDFEKTENNLNLIETNLKKSHQDLENEKRLFRRLTSELKTAERNERRTAIALRDHEQKVVLEEKNLQRCRQKEQAASRARQEIEHEVEMMRIAVKIAETALLIADLALTALIAFSLLNPLVTIACLAIKQAALAAARYALGKVQKELGEKEALLVKRVNDHEIAQEKRKKSEETLNVDRINLETRKNDLTNRKQDVVIAKNKLDQQKIVTENSTEQSKELRKKFDKFRQDKITKSKEIYDNKTDLGNQQNKTNIIKMNIDQLTKDQSQCRVNNERAANDKKSCENEYQNRLNEMQSKVDQLQSSQTAKTRLKANIQINQTDIDHAEKELTNKQQGEHSVKNQIKNIQTELLMVDKSLFDLQSDLREEKNRHKKINKEKSVLQQEYDKTEGQLKTLKKDTEKQEDLRKTLDDNLQIKHRELINQQLRQNQCQYEFNQHQNEIESKHLQREQNETIQAILISSMARNKENIKNLNLQTEPNTTCIEQHEKSKNDIEKHMKELESHYNIAQENLQKLVTNSNDPQGQYDEANTRQNNNINQLHTIQGVQDGLGVQITDHQRQINDCEVEIYRVIQEKILKQDQMENYKERQSAYQYTKENVQTTTHTQPRREQHEQFNYN